MPEQIRIESGDRWDTLELVERLPGCRWYLVERRAGAWDVHLEAQSPALLAELLEVAEGWARDRHVESVVHLSQTDIHLPGRRDGASRQAQSTTAAAA